jgi:outer membrane protein TolC
MRTLGVAICLLSLSVVSTAVEAQEVQQARQEMRLSVEETVRFALEKNLELEIERVNPFIATERISEARAEFHPLVGTSLYYSRQNRYLNSILEGQAVDGIVRETWFTPEAVFGGKLTSGAAYNLSARVSTVESDNPLRLFDTSYTPEITLKFTQPLLRGFGFGVNKVRIRQAEHLEQQALLEVQAKMLAVIREVETKYWLLAFAQQHAEISQSNLDVAEDLIDRLLRMREAGLSTDLDVSQAQLAAESRRSDLARAQADRKIAQTRLREAVDPDLPLTTSVIALETPLDEGPPVDLQEHLDRAMANRPEIRIQESVIESLALEERQARSNARWKLDAVGSTSYSSLGGKDVNVVPLLTPVPLPADLEERDSLGESFENGNQSWSLGLNLEIPLGSRSSLAQLAPAILRRSQEELRLQRLKSQIRIDLETSYHNMTAEWSRLNSAREAVRLAQLQLNAQERSLEAGRTTVWDVIEAQDRLAMALDAEGRGLAFYASARTRLYAAQARSFEVHRMVVEP